MKFVIFIFVSIIAQAGMIPPNFDLLEGKNLSSRILKTSHGEDLNLNQLQNSPVILLPIYTGCIYSCSVSVKNLMEAYKNLTESEKIPVILFSFDPNETIENMREYEDNVHLPAQWFLATLIDKNQKQAFLDEIDFKYFDMGNGQYEHPNITYFLKPHLKINSFIIGVVFKHQELVEKIKKLFIAETLYSNYAARIFAILALIFIVGLITFIFKYQSD